MIVYGSKVKTKEVSRGRFFCPFCCRSREFIRKKIGKYFSLYFVPIIETKKLLDFVECQGCYTPYDVKILIEQEPNYPKETELTKDYIYGIWETMYYQIGCNEIDGNSWSANLVRCGFLMKSAGAFIASDDYNEARKYLKEILYLAQEWMEVRSDSEKTMKKETFTLFDEKTKGFAVASRAVLRVLP